MRISTLFGHRLVLGFVAFVVVALIVFIFAFQPVTRSYVASEFVCSYCHLEREYDPATRLSFSTQHPVELEDGQDAAQCVDCHLPKGFLASAYMYTHIISATDMFGRFRDRPSERSGDWIPAAAARAYRVRQRLFDYDSVTCRSCHIESEIVPARVRGQKAHKSALENQETCIECNDNLVHRYIEVGDDEFQKPETETE